MYYAELWFTATPPYRLAKSIFRDKTREHTITAVRGKTGAAYGIDNTFQWTAAVQGFCALLIDYVLSPSEIVTLSGTRRSLLHSLDQSIAKKCNWCVDMFGADTKGTLTISKFLKRSSLDRSCAAFETHMRVDSKKLPQSHISLYIGSRKLESELEIRALREHLALKSSGVAVLTSSKDRITANDDLPSRPGRLISGSRYHRRAIILDRPVLVPQRLAQIEGENSEEENFEVSRLFVLAGEPSKSKSIVSNLLNSARSRADALYLAGHLSNLSFIALDEDVITARGGLDEFKAEHLRLLTTLELPTVEKMHSHSLEEQIALFRSHDALSLLHLHIFSCTLEAEFQSRSRSGTRNTLWQHYGTIQLLKAFCPPIAWDRYSPFIAQALRLGESALAYKAWCEARRYATSHAVPLRSREADIYSYARLQRKTWSIEWKIHEYLGVCFDILAGKHSLAARRLDLIRSRMTIFPEPYLSAGLSELQKVVEETSSTKSSRVVWPLKLNVSSHASYLTAWPLR